MKKHFLLFLIIVSNIMYSQSFDIVYNADLLYARNNTWLNNIKNDWHAEVINLRIRWSDVLTTLPANNLTQANCNWTEVDDAINKITAKGLRLFLRINLCETKLSWQSSIPNNEVYYAADGNIYYNSSWDAANPLLGPRKIYSIFSSTAVNKMKNFVGLVLDHINTLGVNIELVQVVINPTDESDLPFQSRKPAPANSVVVESVGFSTHEKNAFKSYLLTIYHDSIFELNQKLGYSFTSFDEIITSLNSTWHWHDNITNSSATILYPKLKKDWIDFKAKTLRDFNNNIKTIFVVKGFGNKYGIQPAPLYDNTQEYKGMYDPTSILEAANYITVADIAQYEPQFNFSADFLRSISKYWKWKWSDGRSIRFATESNWMYFDIYNTTPPNNSTWANDLGRYWTKQVKSYYDRGASALFISNWGNDNTDPKAIYTATSVINQTDVTNYSLWRTTLSDYKTKNVQNISARADVYHIGLTMMLYKDSWHTYNIGNSYYNSLDPTINRFIMPIYDFVKKPESTFYNYSSSSGAYTDYGDFVTDFMIENSPSYLPSNNYKIVFTGTSHYISDIAYKNLLRTDLPKETKVMINSTYNSSGYYYFTPGIRNEYNDSRTPIPLIWRTRTDLQSIFPNCDIPSTPNCCGWSSDPQFDIIYWAESYGVDQYPYPGLIIKNSSNKYSYDKNIKSVWDQRSDLQTAFPDGHYYANKTWNMILWAKQYGYSESTLLNYYNSWPYIGGNGSLGKTSNSLNTNIISNQFYLDQNYPNPFNPITIIKYSISAEENITLKVFDLLGREVSTLVDEVKVPGNYSVSFDGSKFSSGVYVYILSNNKQQISKKLLLIK